MRPALAILLDHQVAHLLRSHDIEAQDLARMLTGAPPRKQRGGLSPRRAENMARRDALLRDLRDRIDRDHEWPATKIHAVMARLWRQRAEVMRDPTLAEAACADILHALESLGMSNVILSEKRLAKVLAA